MTVRREQKRRKINLIILVVLVGLFVGLAAIAANNSVSPAEKKVFDVVYGMPDSFRGFALIVTQAGSVWMSLGMVGLLFVTRWKPRAALEVLRDSILAYGLVWLIKIIVARPRPPSLLLDVSARELISYGQGFPSGHTTLATVVSLTVAAYLPKPWRFIVVPWILLVAWSRVYLGVHVPLDVIGGFLLGLIVIYAAKFLPRFERLAFKKRGA